MGVDGTYAIIMDAEIARQKATIELKSNGSELSGKMTGVMGTIEFSGGRVDGGKVSWKMHGKVSAIYPDTHDWVVKATIDGDKISGVAWVAILGDSPFTGSRKASDQVEEALPWVDLGLPRYEALSEEWVKAYDAYVREKAKGKAKGLNVSWSATYTNPPKHLLRGAGHDVIGYTLRVQDDELRVFDGPTSGCDVEATYPYDPSALLMRLNTERYAKWVAEHGESISGKVSVKANKDAARIVNQLLAGPGNDVREEFWAQRTK
jgi:hypothetical protein